MIKLNEKLEMRVGVFGTLMLVMTVLTFIAVLFTNGRVHKVEVQTRMLEREVEITVNQEPFSEEAFIQYLEDINIRFPHVVYAQAYLETGGFKSGIFKANNNLFGMKVAAQRPTTALLLDRGHAVYDSWRSSVLDYALYQSHYLRAVKGRDEYINTIGRVYAEDPNYLKKVKKIIEQKFGKDSKDN